MLEMEVSLDDTKTQTQALGWLMWADFSTAVRDMPKLAFVDGDTEERWVRSKWARVSYTKYAGCTRGLVKDGKPAGHGNLNLNVSPKQPYRGNDMRGRGGKLSGVQGIKMRHMVCQASSARSTTVSVVGKC